MFKSRRQLSPIAIDLGDAGIKVLQLAHCDGQVSVSGAKFVDLAPWLNDPEQKDARSRTLLSEALRAGGFKGKNAVCSLGLSEYQIKNIRLPKMPAEELAQAIEFEAQDRFEMRGAPFQIRHLPAGEVRHGNETKEEVIVFAASDDVVARKMQLLESLGLTPAAIDLSPCAIARAFMRFLRRSEDASAVHVFIDIGRRGTTVVITHGLDVAFVKAVEIGGQHFDSVVAKSLNLDLKQASSIRVRRMKAIGGRRANEQAPPPDEMSLAVDDALRPLAESLLKDIQLCLRYYAVTFRGPRPQSVTLLGGEASEPALNRVFNAELGVPCLLGDPLRGMGSLKAFGIREERSLQPAWAEVCGLALRGTSCSTPRAEAKIQLVGA